jgi:hypothetical protein
MCKPQLFSTLRGFGMKLTDERHLAEYLGIDYKVNKQNKSIEMLRKCLIDKAIDAIENPMFQRKEGLTPRKLLLTRLLYTSQITLRLWIWTGIIELSSGFSSICPPTLARISPLLSNKCPGSPTIRRPLTVTQ